MKTKATCIIWDTDGEEIELPKEMDIPDDIPEDGICDYLSDTTGFCVESFCVEREGTVNGRRVEVGELFASGFYPVNVYDEAGEQVIGKANIYPEDDTSKGIEAAIENAMLDIRWWKKPEETMSIKDLTTKFMEHQLKGGDNVLPLKAYVVFTEDSFTSKLLLAERTFLVWSDSPCFMPIPKDNVQFWGENISVPEPDAVRLDRKMRDGWKVEYAYMIKEEQVYHV